MAHNPLRPRTPRLRHDEDQPDIKPFGRHNRVRSVCQPSGCLDRLLYSHASATSNLRLTSRAAISVWFSFDATNTSAESGGWQVAPIRPQPGSKDPRHGTQHPPFPQCLRNCDLTKTIQTCTLRPSQSCVRFVNPVAVLTVDYTPVPPPRATSAWPREPLSVSGLVSMLPPPPRKSGN
jgi:hypothetical protein